MGCSPSTQFFETKIRSNAALWWSWFFVLAYFVVAIVCDKNWNEEELGRIDAPNRKNNNLTIHPWYSIYKSGHDSYFPKTVRCTQAALNISGYMVVIAGFYFHYKNDKRVPDVDEGTMVAAVAIISILISNPINFLLGVYISGIYPLIKR